MHRLTRSIGSFLPMSDKKRRKIEYKCQYCDKTYGKPCKVAEHERSHTGEVSFHSLLYSHSLDLISFP
jgi:hypothetical protein